ncbi:MAG: EF-P lysine aminoacylase GenX [Lentisphaerae bacterium]|nr:EF-P lysine aminoacylase GenX [Lentisphaerota bacterium]
MSHGIQDDTIRRLARLRLRARALEAIRTFFTNRDYLAVETPIRLPAPALELHIDALSSGPQFLRTSPELHLKRLLADGAERVFEIGSCFRADERGLRHLPEFTMLEWYRAGADYRDLMEETEALVAAVWAAVRQEPAFAPSVSGVDGPWARLTVRDAFLQFAGWDPVAHYDPDRFDLDLVQLVEPGLPRERPLFLTDYPVEAAALARCRPEVPPVAERWELYAGGLELANAYSELTDAAEQRRRFEACAVDRAALGKTVYPLDEAFMAALERGLPPSAGIALGLDRLIMVLTGAERIDDVRAFVP